MEHRHKRRLLCEHEGKECSIHMTYTSKDLLVGDTEFTVLCCEFALDLQSSYCLLISLL